MRSVIQMIKEIFPILKRKALTACLYSKRLYKKLSFLALLVAIIAVTVFTTVSVSGDNNMLRIAVVPPLKNYDDSAKEIIENLLKSDGSVEYSLTTIEQGQELLKNGKVDSVWKFRANFDKKIYKAVATPNKTKKESQSKLKLKPVVVVYVRENNVFTMLAVERLHAELYPVMSEIFYDIYTEKHLDPTNLEGVEKPPYPQEKNDSIVEISYYNDNISPIDTNFLLSPIRGILAIITSLAALSSALYFLHDRDRGLLDAVPLNRRFSRLCAYVTAGAANIAVFQLVAIYISGLGGRIWVELLSLVLFLFLLVGFAAFVTNLLRRTAVLATLLPFLMILMLVACPVFLNTDFGLASWCFPAYWYLTAVYNTSYLWKMALFGVLLFAAAFLLSKLPEKKTS